MGSALALAYAEQFPVRVTELILSGVTTGRREEFDWLFRDGLGAFFPEEQRMRRTVHPAARVERRLTLRPAPEERGSRRPELPLELGHEGERRGRQDLGEPALERALELDAAP